MIVLPERLAFGEGNSGRHSGADRRPLIAGR
jgi:hypothetical protein